MIAADPDARRLAALEAAVREVSTWSNGRAALAYALGDYLTRRAMLDCQAILVRHGVAEPADAP